MIDNLLLHHCLSPIKVAHKPTNSYNYVPCGKCTFCRSHKFSVLRQKLDNEIRNSKFVYVFTLTYSPEFVPTIVFSPSSTSNYYFRNIDSFTDRFNLHKYVNSPTFDKTEFDNIAYKQNNQNQIYINVYSHYQLFLKRLRKFIFKTFQTKIRFFITLEYGSKTIRPHAHLILFSPTALKFQFSTLKDSKSVVCSELSKLWSKGFVTYDGTPIKSDSLSSYISNYVNSVNHVPTILAYKLIKPRSVHSSFLGINSQISIEDIEQNTISFVTRQRVFTPSNKLLSFDLLTSSEVSYFFPRLPFTCLHDTNSLNEFSSFFINNNTFRFKNLKDFSDYILSNPHTQIFNYLCINSSHSFSVKFDYTIIENLISDFPQPSHINIFNLFTSSDIPFLANNYVLPLKSFQDLLTALSRLYSAYYFFRSIYNRFISPEFSFSRYISLYFSVINLTQNHLLHSTLYDLQYSPSDYVSLYYHLIGSSIDYNNSVLTDLLQRQQTQIDNNIKHKTQSSIL